MLQNLIKNSIFVFFAMLAFMQVLQTSFVKHLTECHKNTICIDFQVHNPKLIQEGCFETYIYHKRLCARLLYERSK